MLKMHACIANLEMKKEDVEKVQTGRVREFAVVERERERDVGTINMLLIF